MERGPLDVSRLAVSAGLGITLRNSVDPNEVLRNLLARAIAPDVLPSTKIVRLFHVRGVASRSIGNEMQDLVIYGPEFVYVCDVGFPMLPAVLLNYIVAGNGDPNFPDFA